MLDVDLFLIKFFLKLMFGRTGTCHKLRIDIQRKYGATVDKLSFSVLITLVINGNK